ncbi:hypothetical protein R3W88_031720 [Solanum pinnatisectum]|uniref:Uncharacterized protein n=1 Tax=Solanum pinnatisectum TaxID=50273 RepID=A0AAV9LMH9_9SOLN|nr:hypothetical protein R3W88_031720 [Solanum pinnatisectum]
MMKNESWLDMQVHKTDTEANIRQLRERLAEVSGKLKDMMKRNTKKRSEGIKRVIVRGRRL